MAKKKQWKVELQRESTEYAVVYVEAASKKEAMEQADKEMDPAWSKEQVTFCGAVSARAVKDA